MLLDDNMESVNILYIILQKSLYVYYRHLFLTEIIVQAETIILIVININTFY